MKKIFICYRRDDTSGFSISLYERLIKEFGKDNVFKDLDSIAIGEDFRKTLMHAISKCDIVIALIGKHFATVRDLEGNLRLHDPNDFVHIELKNSLELGKIIVPILIDTTMPVENELPDVLKPLLYLQNFELRTTKWTSDVELLIKQLKMIMKSSVRQTSFLIKNFTKIILYLTIIISCLTIVYVFVKIYDPSKKISFGPVKALIADERYSDARSILDSLQKENPTADSIKILKKQLEVQSVWSGIWNQAQSSGSQGKIIIKTDGDTVAGNFININQSKSWDYRNKISGKIFNNGQTIKGNWENALGKAGTFTFNLQNDKTIFSGNADNDTWHGTKILNPDLQKYFDEKFIIKSITNRFYVIVASTNDFSGALRIRDGLILKGLSNSKILISNAFGISIDDFDDIQAALVKVNEIRQNDYVDAYYSKH